MRHVSDAFLLNMAEVSASLVGLFLVGVFFYVETGFHRLTRSRDAFEQYLRSGTRITLIVFTIPIGVSMGLVVLELVWARSLFLVLSLLLVAANVDTAIRIRGVAGATRSKGLLLNEIVTTVLTIVAVVVPWVLGGFRPSREDLTWAVLLAFAAGFLSIGATVMSAFDVARADTTELPRGDGVRLADRPRPMSENPSMAVRPIRSDELTAHELASMRALFEGSFSEDEPFTGDDLAHTMGGVHFVVERDARIVSHASVVERELHVDGRRLSTGYVEGVATLPAYQHRGFAAEIMGRVGEHVDRTFELGALATGLVGFYERFGWIAWRGPTSVRIDRGFERTPDEDGSIFVRLTPTSPELDLTAPISCEWRPGDVW
jgi:aminoglycoside 2'-N-acetyltransferase I